VPLEELDREVLLHLAEPAENRGVIDAEPVGGTRQAIGFGDDFHEPEIIPIEVLLLGHDILH
jgi:hypothetical protein